MREERIDWIDYAKSIAIFLVIVLHIHCDAILTQLINAFIMPTFFVISGILFSRKRNPKFKPFALKRARQLVVPFLWINVVAYIAWLIVLRHYGNTDERLIAWHSPLIGIFTGIPPLLVHDIPLWSLLSFFVAEMVYYPLGRMVRSPLTIAAGAFIVAWLLSLTIPQYYGWLPLSLGPSVAGLGFYAIGQWLRKFQFVLNPMSQPALAGILLPGSAVIYLAAALTNNVVHYYVCHYFNFGLFLVAAVAGAICLMIVSSILSHLHRPGKIILLISRGTLIICGFHLLVLAAIKGVLLIGLHLSPDIIKSTIWHGLGFALITYLLCLPIIYLISRYCRILVDK